MRLKQEEFIFLKACQLVFNLKKIIFQIIKQLMELYINFILI